MQKSHQILFNIRAIREMKGFTQQQISRKLGITQSRYARFETEGTKIDYKLIEKIAAVLEVDVVFIINFHNNKVYLVDESDRKYVAEPRANYKSQVTELESLKEEIAYLQRINQLLEEQIRDKSDLIKLFKSHQAKRKKR